MKIHIGSIVRHTILGALSLILMVPLYITLVNTFKHNIDIVNNPLGIPLSRLTLSNILYGLSGSAFNVVGAYLTSMLVTICVIVLTIVLSSLLSYAIARSKKRIMRFLYVFLLAGLMVPPAVVLIPGVKLLHFLGLMFTPAGLIIYDLAIYIPFTVFVYVGFVRTIPLSLEESAIIDGANRLTVYWKIIFPLLRPATGSVVIFLFIWVWNDFLNPLIILGPAGSNTIVTALYHTVGKFNSNWGHVYGLIFLSVFPLLLLYLFMQRYFIHGLTEGAIKG